MLPILENNFILSALVALVIVLIIYFDSRKKDTRNISSYLRYFVLSFLLVLGTLFFRTRNFSLPSISLHTGGGGLGIGGGGGNLGSTRGGAGNTISGLTQSDLLNIGEPNF